MHIINRACRLRVVAGLSEPDKRSSTYIVGIPLMRVRDPRYYDEKRNSTCADGRPLVRVRDPRYYDEPRHAYHQLGRPLLRVRAPRYFTGMKCGQ